MKINKMDYKEKLVELATKCLNDEKLEAAIIFDGFRAYRHLYVSYYYNNVKCKSVSKLKEEYKLDDTWETSKKLFFSSLVINFNETPPIHIYYNTEEKTEETKINIPHRIFLFFKGKEQFIIKTATTYIPKYLIQQGSLIAELNVEEADALAKLYQANFKKFSEKRDLAKLNERLEKYQ